MTSVRQVQQLTAEVLAAANSAYLDAEGRDSRGAAFEAAISVAFNAGRESAFDGDEWRVCAGPAEFPTVFQDEVRSQEHLALVIRDAQNRWRRETIWVQHRRTGATEWEQVAE